MFVVPPVKVSFAEACIKFTRTPVLGQQRKIAAMQLQLFARRAFTMLAILVPIGEDGRGIYSEITTMEACYIFFKLTVT